MAQSQTHRTRRKFPTHIVVFLAPATIIYTLFMIYPLLDSMRLSFFAADNAGNELFVGFENYITLLTNELWKPRLWGAFRNNVIFFIIHMVVQNSIGLLLAALLTSRTVRGATFFRTIFFLPTMLSVVIVGFVWQLILSPLWGIAEGMLVLCGIRGSLPALAGPGGTGADRSRLDFGLAIYRHSHDVILRHADQHPR